VPSSQTDLTRVFRSSCLLTAMVATLAATPGPTSAQTAAAEGVPPPVSFWGVRLRAPLDTTEVEVGGCVSGSEFAHGMGTYSRLLDDMLLGLLPHEHEDSLPVLRALDSVQVCIASVPTSGAMVFGTVMNSLVVHALFMWPDEANRPSVASPRRLVAEQYGRPNIREEGVHRWAADSVSLDVESVSRLGYGVTLTLSDARGCEQFERVLHGGTPPPAEPTRNPCWTPVGGGR